MPVSLTALAACFRLDAGFPGFYHSRASRGAFDLIAIIGEKFLSIQVKYTSTGIVKLSLSEINRLKYWGSQLNRFEFFTVNL
jgi:Holliday junction resolvase